jgi:hypothetical protein
VVVAVYGVAFQDKMPCLFSRFCVLNKFTITLRNNALHNQRIEANYFIPVLLSKQDNRNGPDHFSS